MSQKNSPEVFWHFYHKRLRIFNQFLHTHYTFLSTLDYKCIFIQLSPTLTKLCHIKRDSSWPPSTETHAFRRLRKSLIALSIVVCGSLASHPRSVAVYFWALGWSLALTEVCQILEASHHTHGSRVGWRLVSSVATGFLRWSQCNSPSTIPASVGPCELNTNPDGNNHLAVVNEHLQQTSDVICRVLSIYVN